MIGLSLPLAYPFLRLGRKNFILGSILIILGWYVQDISVEHSWLLWLGLGSSRLLFSGLYPNAPLVRGGFVWCGLGRTAISGI